MQMPSLWNHTIFKFLIMFHLFKKKIISTRIAAQKYYFVRLMYGSYQNKEYEIVSYFPSPSNPYNKNSIKKLPTIQIVQLI